MDMTCSYFIFILAPGTRLLPILQNRVPTLTKILPRPHCHQRLPLQNLVIQTRSPSNLFSRVYPPGFPGLSPSAACLCHVWASAHLTNSSLHSPSQG